LIARGRVAATNHQKIIAAVEWVGQQRGTCTTQKL
jgi:hypothetical protein